MIKGYDEIFNWTQGVKSYWFLPFAKNMDKSLSSKFGQKLLDRTKKSAIDALKTVSKGATQKMVEATVDLVGNEIAEKITKTASKSTLDAPSKSVMPTQITETSIQPTWIPVEKYVLPERWQQIWWT